MLWTNALNEHDRIHLLYLPYETDPELVLLYPAITDVTIDDTVAFHDAAARAQALRTETGPLDIDHAESYHRAVTHMSRCRSVCEDTGRRLGHTHLVSPAASDMDKAIKLIRHARGADTDFERAGYLDRALRLVTDLLGRSTLRVNATARYQLENLADAPALNAGSDRSRES